MSAASPSSGASNPRLCTVACARCNAGRPRVISLGGGAFLQTENLDLVLNNGVSVWLDCPLPVIERRIAAFTHRPLARDPNQLRHLYEVRREGYARADYRIDTDDDDAAATVARILALPLF